MKPTRVSWSSVSRSMRLLEVIGAFATEPGFYCKGFCSAPHLEMAGYLIVRP